MAAVTSSGMSKEGLSVRTVIDTETTGTVEGALMAIVRSAAMETRMIAGVFGETETTGGSVARAGREDSAETEIRILDAMEKMMARREEAGADSRGENSEIGTGVTAADLTEGTETIEREVSVVAVVGREAADSEVETGDIEGTEEIGGTEETGGIDETKTAEGARGVSEGTMIAEGISRSGEIMNGQIGPAETMITEESGISRVETMIEAAALGKTMGTKMGSGVTPGMETVIGRIETKTVEGIDRRDRRTESLRARKSHKVERMEMTGETRLRTRMRKRIIGMQRIDLQKGNSDPIERKTRPLGLAGGSLTDRVAMRNRK